MNKKQLLDQLIFELEQRQQTAIAAAQRAHNTATDKANIAENKYDTLGLEAAYLAEGQAKRASEFYAELEAIQKLPVKQYTQKEAIALGVLVRLIDEQEKQHWFFLAPAAGGFKLIFEQKNIVVITSSSPLGSALLGKFVDDDVELITASQKKSYLISEIY